MISIQPTSPSLSPSAASPFLLFIWCFERRCCETTGAVVLHKYVYYPRFIPFTSLLWFDLGTDLCLIRFVCECACAPLLHSLRTVSYLLTPLTITLLGSFQAAMSRCNVDGKVNCFIFSVFVVDLRRGCSYGGGFTNFWMT